MTDLATDKHGKPIGEGTPVTNGKLSGVVHKLGTMIRIALDSPDPDGKTEHLYWPADFKNNRWVVKE